MVFLIHTELRCTVNHTSKSILFLPKYQKSNCSTPILPTILNKFFYQNYKKTSKIVMAFDYSEYRCNCYRVIGKSSPIWQRCTCCRCYNHESKPCTVVLIKWESVFRQFEISSCGPGSSNGIATDYGLDGPWSNPGGDEIFRPSRPALGVHPATYKMGTGSFPWIEAAGAWDWPPPHPHLKPRS